MDLLWTLDKVKACLKMQLFSWQVSIHLKVLLPPQSPVIVWDSANPLRFLLPTRDPMNSNEVSVGIVLTVGRSKVKVMGLVASRRALYVLNLRLALIIPYP